jgi:hypothetical protein
MRIQLYVSFISASYASIHITRQMLQDQQFLATSRLKKWANIPLEVSLTPKCSVIDESWVRLTTAFMYSSCTTIWHFIFNREQLISAQKEEPVLPCSKSFSVEEAGNVNVCYFIKD